MIVAADGAGRAPLDFPLRSGLFAFWLVLAAALAGCASNAASTAAQADDLGVLVMARGGSDDWNRDVKAALAPLGEDYPLEMALGMADAASLQKGVSALEARGARRIAVVRLFVSSESWRERTEQILGIAPGAPPKPARDMHTPDDAPARKSAFWRIETNAVFALSDEGLSDAPEMGTVLVERARGLSRDPANESVLILAHGPRDDAENERWLVRIDARADALRQAMPFRAVLVETLREDWPEKRKEVEARVRAFVAQAARDGGRAIVIPFRVQGFGPYAKVLEGLAYEADGKGLTPSPEIERWARRQVEEMASGEFQTPIE